MANARGFPKTNRGKIRKSRLRQLMLDVNITLHEKRVIKDCLNQKLKGRKYYKLCDQKYLLLEHYFSYL